MCRADVHRPGYVQTPHLHLAGQVNGSWAQGLIERRTSRSILCSAASGCSGIWFDNAEVLNLENRISITNNIMISAPIIRITVK
mmetsp:Transcript_78013/g.210127  ORF Transcript_78013/g.210127 Transcript_78013/m.210127 type:complete len:84 (-) Transcript_78013:22-273(-)